MDGEEGQVTSVQLYDESDYPETLLDTAEALTEVGFDVTKRREIGDPAGTITTVAEGVDDDCIAICGQKRTPTGKIIFEDHLRERDSVGNVVREPARPRHHGRVRLSGA